MSERLARPAVLAILLVQFVAVVGLAGYYHGRDSSDSCIRCHADRAAMAAAGWPQFYVTSEQVEKESGMPGATCRDCHLGDGRSETAAGAHKGMLRPMVIDTDARIVQRKGTLPALVPTGSDRMYAMMPKDEGGAPDPRILTVLWHDRDPVTLGYDPAIAKKTCGRPGCHPSEVAQFGKSDMGGNVRQRSMRYWLDRHGPNNCGPSFADLPPGAGCGYSPKNYDLIKSDLSCPSSYTDAADRQRFCNVCHAGCLDCHYYPSGKTGAHTFTDRIPAVNCEGGGRGTGMCHAGTQERRRGDSYLGAEFSQPPGMTPDSHVKAGLLCIDCHQTGEGGMGDIERRADCGGCHYFIARAHGSGVHRRLRCAACHVSRLGGYEMTVWGKGYVSGRPNPFTKYSLYYGFMEPPILMKDQDGLYTPYKVWPNVATNIKNGVKKRGGIDFRWPGGGTRDAYALLGTYSTLPGANKALAWLQMEEVSHPLGRSRTCRSCHASTSQRSHASWEYVEYAGSEPFTGRQDIVADENGLRVINIKETSPLKPLGDARACDFAAWMYLDGVWNIKGDLSIPRGDEKRYEAYKEEADAFNAKINALEARLSRLPRGGGAYRAFLKRIKRIKEIGEHDPDAGLALLSKGNYFN